MCHKTRPSEFHPVSVIETMCAPGTSWMARGTKWTEVRICPNYLTFLKNWFWWVFRGSRAGAVWGVRNAMHRSLISVSSPRELSGQQLLSSSKKREIWEPFSSDPYMFVIPCNTSLDPSAILKKKLTSLGKKKSAKASHTYFHIPFLPCIVQVS